jgi:hypothetical protein
LSVGNKNKIKFFWQSISIERYLLPKKYVENKHGKIYPWTQMDTDANREKNTTVRNRDANG